MKRLRLVVIGIVALALIPTIALAQKTTSQYTNLTPCQRFDSAIKDRVASINNTRVSRADTVARIDARINGLIGRLEARGQDKAKIVTDQQEFKRRAAIVDRDYKDIMNSVESAMGSCAAAGSLQAARDKLDILNSDTKDFKNWLQMILRVDILSLKTAGKQ